MPSSEYPASILSRFGRLTAGRLARASEKAWTRARTSENEGTRRWQLAGDRAERIDHVRALLEEALYNGPFPSGEENTVAAPERWSLLPVTD